MSGAGRSSARAPDDVLQRAVNIFEDEGQQFVPSSTFQGRRPGYYFSRGSKGQGYYLDARQPASTQPPVFNTAGDGDGNDNEEEAPGPSFRPPPSRPLDPQALLQEAEEAAGDAQQLQYVDAKGLKRLVTTLERRYNHNLEQRLKYADEPHRFIESEIDLDEAVKGMMVVASSPELYPELVGLGAVTTLLALLHHENGDIAADTIELLSELTDDDAIEDSEEEARILVNALLEGGLMDLLVQRLSTLNEDNEEEAAAVYNSLSVVENAIEVQPEATEAAARKAGLLPWLLQRLKRKDRAADGNAQYSSEILAVLLQAGEATRDKFTEQEGIDVVLQAVAPYRNREPKTVEEEELIENLFNVLCLALMSPKGKDSFVSAEGIELMLLMLKGGKAVRLPALKCLDFSTTECPAACDRCIDKGGLKTVFAMFMGRLKSGKKRDETQLQEEEERCVSVISNLLKGATKSALKDRVAAKFVENEFEKCDRLMEIVSKYEQRVISAEGRLAEEVVEEEADEDDFLLARLDAGLYTLQQACLITGALWALNDLHLRKRILMHLHQTGRTLGMLRSILLEYRSSLGTEGTATNRSGTTGGTESDRVVSILAALGYQVEESRDGNPVKKEDGSGDDKDTVKLSGKRPREEEGALDNEEEREAQRQRS